MKKLIVLILTAIFCFAGCKKDQLVTDDLDMKESFVVLIDAAHGGRDPGAVSNSGRSEKEIVLSISKKLEKVLKQEGLRVEMTRKNDTFVSLQNRIQLSQKSGTDLLVCIHNNNSRDLTERGFTTFYQRQNQKSMKLDSLVHAEFNDLNLMPDKGGRDASFYILKESIAPAIIIDLGFLSNPDDEKLLTDLEFQSQFVVSLKEAILKYIDSLE
ncbi:MAG TPA: N-acetylmuramoyl-L-alanine amidase [bacterium]